jgi:hypothetical protein
LSIVKSFVANTLGDKGLVADRRGTTNIPNKNCLAITKSFPTNIPSKKCIVTTRHFTTNIHGKDHLVTTKQFATNISGPIHLVANRRFLPNILARNSHCDHQGIHREIFNYE